MTTWLISIKIAWHRSQYCQWILYKKFIFCYFEQQSWFWHVNIFCHCWNFSTHRIRFVFSHYSKLIRLHQSHCLWSSTLSFKLHELFLFESLSLDYHLCYMHVIDIFFWMHSMFSIENRICFWFVLKIHKYQHVVTTIICLLE